MEQPMRYNFSASVPIVEGRLTYLKFAIPDAPDAQINAAPTITRNFSSSHQVDDVTMAEMLPSSMRTSEKQTSARVAGGLPPSFTPEPSGQACVTRNNRYDISSGQPAPMMHQSKDTPSTQACTTDNSPESPPRGHGLSSPIDTSDEFLIHRLHREERKCQKTNAEKENGIEPPMLSYFEMDGKQSLSAPPSELSGHPKLQIGDLFCYRQAGTNDTSLWIWSRGQGTHCDWQRVFTGFTRPVDSRMLAIVGNPKRPTWVTASWYRRRFLKQPLRG